MKRTLIGAIALLLAAGAVSCSSSKKASGPAAPAGMVEEAIPLSGAQYRSNAEYYRAVQNGVSTERSTAQKIAMQNCRQDTGVSAEHKSQYQELAYTAVGQQLRDVQVVEEKMFRQDNGSFRYYVCMQLPKAALEAAIEDAIAKDAKLNLEFDRAQFKKIFEEQMAVFSQQ